MLSERTKSAMQFAIFADLTPPEFELVIGAAREKRFARRDMIFTEGDPVRLVTLVVSGFVKVTQMGLNGNEVILRLSGAGEIVGSYRAGTNLTHCATAQAVQPSVALVWDAGTFEKLQARVPVFRRNTIRALEDRLLEMEQRFREVSTEKVGSRLSSELVRICDRLRRSAENGDLENALSRAELAQLTGTTLFTVSRLLCQWQTRGIVRGGAGKARVFTFLSAKGGAGCTTAAVNTALALQKSHGDVVLVDFARLGHAALHLNLRPQFGVHDALQNLHRMDVSLLDGFMTTTKEGLHLLAGPQQHDPNEPTSGELARLFDLLVNHYRFVIVDASSRLDRITKLLSDLSNAVLVIAQTDMVSLWSVGRIRSFLEEDDKRDRIYIVLNRYKKIRGFTDEDVQSVTNCNVLWRVPNAYGQSEIARSYRGLAAVLGGTGMPSKPDDGPEDGDPKDGGPPGIPAKDPIFNNGFLVCWPS